MSNLGQLEEGHGRTKQILKFILSQETGGKEVQFSWPVGCEGKALFCKDSKT